MREVPASVGQRLLWLMDHYGEGDSPLNEQILWHLRGDCDPVALRRAVDALSVRHESLRTTFTARGPRLTQVVHDPRPVDLRQVDVTAEADPRLAAREVIAGEVRTPVAVADWPVRATLVRIAADHHVFALTMHHFITDDWSNGLLSRDLRALYAGEDDLPEIGWQYADWAQWHQGVLAGEDRARLTDYWQQQLDGARLPVLPAAADVPRAEGEPGWLSVEYPITAATSDGLRQLARRHRTTLFPVMMALFNAVLFQRGGQRDVTVASLFANRGRPEVRETVGFFVGMVLLRCRIAEDTTFSDLVTQARTTLMDGMRHQDLPYQLLPGGTFDGQGRADDVMFQLLGSFQSRADMDGEELDDLEAQLERRRFALEFVVVPQADGLTALLLCSRDRFDPAWAEALVRDYVRLAEAVVADPAFKVGLPEGLHP